ncbi:hypothetical protein D3C87_1347480 [compost metagenome]
MNQVDILFCHARFVRIALWIKQHVLVYVIFATHSKSFHFTNRLGSTLCKKMWIVFIFLNRLNHFDLIFCRRLIPLNIGIAFFFRRHRTVFKELTQDKCSALFR